MNRKLRKILKFQQIQGRPKTEAFRQWTYMGKNSIFKTSIHVSLIYMIPIVDIFASFPYSQDIAAVIGYPGNVRESFGYL